MSVCFNEQKQHIGPLQMILKTENNFHEYVIVKWCPVCGAVVIDSEMDNIVRPGHHMKMRFPQTCENIQM